MKYPDISQAHELLNTAAADNAQNVYRWAAGFLTDPANFLPMETGESIEPPTSAFFRLLDTLPISVCEKLDHVRFVFLGEVSAEYEVLAVEPFTLLLPEAKEHLLHALNVVSILFDLAGQLNDAQKSIAGPMRSNAMQVHKTRLAGL